jgi:hypothetical protein
MTFFWVKSSIIGTNFFLYPFKNKIMFNFVIFVATIKGRTTNCFSLLSFVAVFGSGIRDGQKSGSGIRNTVFYRKMLTWMAGRRAPQVTATARAAIHASVWSASALNRVFSDSCRQSPATGSQMTVLIPSVGSLTIW